MASRSPLLASLDRPLRKSRSTATGNHGPLSLESTVQNDLSTHRRCSGFWPSNGCALGACITGSVPEPPAIRLALTASPPCASCIPSPCRRRSVCCAWTKRPPSSPGRGPRPPSQLAPKSRCASRRNTNAAEPPICWGRWTRAPERCWRSADNASGSRNCWTCWS